MRNIFHNLKGEDKSQLLILCDKDGKALGMATREECHRGKGKIHLAFIAFIVDENKKIILTKRSSKKTLWPGYWDGSIVSHILPGESVKEAARRRGKEELGIEAEFQILGNFYYRAGYGKKSENEFCYILCGATRNKIDPNPVEIEALRKINYFDLLKEIKRNAGQFTPWLVLALDRIEEKVFKQ